MASVPEQVRTRLDGAMKSYVDSMEDSIKVLEEQIKEASEMSSICTSEWCEATEHVIDDLNNFLFSISEPRDGDPAVSKRLKELRRRIHDLYADYRDVSRKAR